MSDIELGSPIFRIAAVTGEEPADVEAAIATLTADGWSFDRVWRLLEVGVESGEKIVDIAARALGEPKFAGRRVRATHGERFKKHQRNRAKRRR